MAWVTLGAEDFGAILEREWKHRVSGKILVAGCEWELESLEFWLHKSFGENECLVEEEG